jgi:hypothetical protein
MDVFSPPPPASGCCRWDENLSSVGNAVAIFVDTVSVSTGRLSGRVRLGLEISIRPPDARPTTYRKESQNININITSHTTSLCKSGVDHQLPKGVFHHELLSTGVIKHAREPRRRPQVPQPNEYK